MKAIVYAVKDSTAPHWNWRISLDFETDLRFWRQGAGGGGSPPGPGPDLLRLEPPLPLGAALDLARALNRDAARFGKGAPDRPGDGHLDRLLRRCCGVRGMEPPAPGSVRLVRIGSADVGAGGAAGSAPALLLAKFLRGRALIPEEIVGYLRRNGLEKADEVWASCVQWAYLSGWAEIEPGLQAERARGRWGVARRLVFRCARCGSAERMRRTWCASCGQMCTYCEACLNMGRVRECTPIVAGPAPPGPAVSSGLPFLPAYPAEREPRAERGPIPATPAAAPIPAPGGAPEPAEPRPVRRPLVQPAIPVGRPEGRAPAAPVEPEERDLVRWGLSEAQKESVRQAIRFLGRCRAGLEPPPREFLVWAVTGAGKTEMLFPLIEDAIRRGERVLIATPRRDVVKELEPRLARAFPHAPPAALYGGSEAKWESGPVMLATTHQLLRFRHCFDLVVIDELDAFPYHNNPVLQLAARRAGKPCAPRILLTATPPAPLEKRARRGRLPHVKVPVRYHGHPLPVPVRVQVPPAAAWIRRGRVPRPVLRLLRQSLERGAQVFVFVPRIALVDPLVRLIGARFPTYGIEGVSARDAGRTDKVLQFRERATRLIVTTTILERGVTVKRADVYVADADDRLFDAAALIQMAGRAGRSAEDPAGRVWFLSGHWTRPQRRAIRSIRMMNREARKAGYLR